MIPYIYEFVLRQIRQPISEAVLLGSHGYSTNKQGKWIAVEEGWGLQSNHKVLLPYLVRFSTAHFRMAFLLAPVRAQ